jgi:hypothetical protein
VRSIAAGDHTMSLVLRRLHGDTFFGQTLVAAKNNGQSPLVTGDVRLLATVAVVSVGVLAEQKEV